MYFKNGWGVLEMLEVFKIAVFLLICIILTALFSTLLLTALFIIVLIYIFYDFDFETSLERHAINKVKHGYLKVRNISVLIYPLNNSGLNNYSSNMSNMNKSATEFDLSRFNNSGSIFTPKIGSTTSISRRLQPSHTSTPLTRNSPWQKNSTSSVKQMTFQNSTIQRSPRYTLSSPPVTSPKNNSLNGSSPTVQTSAGPLLASTRFNINLGTYTDTKSPGLVGRVVQYHNESQNNQSQTHQAKYSSPGQFPIVQLYKRELPIIKPRRCTVRIAPPDSSPYNSAEVNTILRETFVQNNKETNKTETEINTKSVLDALKEISRKRIHSDDDVDEVSKRQRKSSVCSPASSTDNTNKDGKRLREDTPPKAKGTPVSPKTNVSKKICVTDEIECSLSSSILMRLQGQKRKAAVQSMTNANKQRKLSTNDDHISRETQTNLKSTTAVTNFTQTNFNELDNASREKPSSEVQPEEKTYNGIASVLQKTGRKKKEFHEKTIREIDAERSTFQFEEPRAVKPIFSSAPLEIIRKNRFATAMSVLTGDEPNIIPLPNLTLSQMKEKLLKESKPSSILSPPNKTKHDKHVTFDIPLTEKSGNTNLQNSFTSESITTVSSDIELKSTMSMTSITTTGSEPKLVPTPQNSPVSIESTQIPFTTPNFNFSSSGPEPTTTVPPKLVSFGPVTTTTAANNTITSPAVNDTVQPSSSINFGSPNNFGFNGKPAFGVTSPNNTTSTSNTINFGFNSTSAPSLPFNTPSTAPPPFPQTTVTPSLSFGTTTSVLPFGSTASTTSGVSFGTTKPAISFGTPVTTSNTGMFGFGNATTTAPATGGFPFGGTKAQSPPKTGGFKFDLGKPAQPPTNELPKTIESKGTFAFGPATNTTAATVFGAPAVTNVFGTTTSAFAPTTTSAFGAPTTTSTFGAPTTTSTFGAPTTTSTFGAPTTTSAFGASATTNTFGAPTTNTFGAPTTTSAFGAPTTNTFGAPTTTAFGAPTTNTFGGPTTAFGTPTTTAFGAPTTTFGTPTTTASIFGVPTTAPPAFGTPKTTESAFGTFGTPATTQNSFGTPVTTQNSFGTFNTPTTTQNTAFGGFGTPKTTFAPTTTTSTFNFGSNTPSKTFTFGQKTVTTTASNVFGSSGSTFGSPAPSGMFGTPTTTASIVPSGSNVFGTPTTTTNAANVFGTPSATTTAASMFGTTTTTTQSAFGQQSGGVFGQSGFGTTTNGPSFAQNNTFGSPAAAGFGAAPNVAPFGSGTTTQTNVFGGTNNNQPNAFASPSTNTFGASGTFGGFGASTTQASGFGTTPSQPATGVFGAAPTQPATGGFGGANTQPSTFGSFGATTSQTAAPQPGVFAFGGPPSNATPAPTNTFQFATTNTPTKPAGFNFSGSNTTPNMNFNASTPAPAFGATPAPGGFATPNTGMFSIGSGSTAPKQRPIIKARRRNN